MGIRIKVDEDLPSEVAELIVLAGYDASTVVGQGWAGWKDADIWRHLQEEGRWLITADKGFADTRLFPPGSHFGVVLLRMPRESRAGYLSLVRQLLQTVKLDAYAGAVLVVTPGGVRVNKP